ncbi:MAG: DNA-binding protein [Betaproteobacteria bacterium]
MALKNLIGISLAAIEPDSMLIHRLLDAAKISLKDAELANLSSEGRFDMAYKAIMQLSNVALQANGFRTLTSKPGHHQTMIQSLPQTIGLTNNEMILLDQMRKQRNVIDYSGDVVSATLANAAVRQANLLMIQIENWLRKNKPELLD